MKQVLVIALLSVFFVGKPWPRYFQAYRVQWSIKDNTAPGGRRMRMDTIPKTVEVDYARYRMNIGDAKYQFDTTIDAPNGGDSEKIFFYSIPYDIRFPSHEPSGLRTVTVDYLRAAQKYADAVDTDRLRHWVNVFLDRRVDFHGEYKMQLRCIDSLGIFSLKPLPETAN